MADSTLGLGLATIAAVAVNTSYVVQHGALTRLQPLGGRSAWSTVRSLLASRRWLLGAALGYGGLFAQIAAMALTPAWVVQTVLTGGLAVGLAAWSRSGRRVPIARQLAAVFVLALGLAAVIGSMRATTVAARVPVVGLTLYATAAAAIALAVTRLAPSRSQAVADAVGAGLLYGITTTAIATSLALFAHSVALAACSLAIAGASAVTGLPRFQRALQATNPVAAVVLMSAATNAAALFGTILLVGRGVPPPVATLGLCALLAAGFVAARPAGELAEALTAA